MMRLQKFKRTYSQLMTLSYDMNVQMFASSDHDRIYSIAHHAQSDVVKALIPTPRPGDCSHSRCSDY